MTRCSVIVLTMGDRAAELRALVASLPSSEGFEGLLVANGAPVEPVDGWATIDVTENIGISAGRHLGASRATGDILVFLDDDCTVRTPDLLLRAATAFDADPALGAIALRIVVKDTDRSLSEWQPRIRGAKETGAGLVTSFTGGAHAVRATAYERVGGYHPAFWYAHEETDLAWRLLDDGWTIGYRPDLVVEHPLTTPARHGRHLWYSARNRVWLARRNLPLTVAAAYQCVWLAIQLMRARSIDDYRQILAGTREGWRANPGGRQPMSWSTIRRMIRLGRPPII